MKPARHTPEGKNHYKNKLLKAILLLKNAGEAEKFFNDLLTKKELIEFAQRWKVAKLLAEKKSYIAIEKDTGMSSTTIARINKCLQCPDGGYRIILQRIDIPTK